MLTIFLNPVLTSDTSVHKFFSVLDIIIYFLSYLIDWHSTEDPYKMWIVDKNDKQSMMLPVWYALQHEWLSIILFCLPDLQLYFCNKCSLDSLLFAFRLTMVYMRVSRGWCNSYSIL